MARQKIYINAFYVALKFFFIILVTKKSKNVFVAVLHGSVCTSCSRTDHNSARCGLLQSNN